MELLIKSLIISLFCVGLRIASDKGMILWFLRMPYEWLVSEIEEVKLINSNNQLYTSIEYNTRKVAKKRVAMINIVIYILKPVIACSTCMASTYTILIEYVYYDLSKWTILTVFIVAAMNSIIHAAYTKLSK